MKKSFLLVFAFALTLFSVNAQVLKPGQQAAKPLTGGNADQYGAVEKAKDDTLVIHKWIVGLYPFSFVGSSIMLGVEHRMSPGFTMKLNGAVGFADANHYYGVENLTSGYGELQFRYYPSKNACRGFYGMGYTYYKHVSFTTSNNFFFNNTLPGVKGQSGAFSLGVAVGFQRIISNLVAVDFYLGGGPTLPGGDYKLVDLDVFDDYRRGITLQAGFMVGLPLK